jgi:hypothetical protein
MVERTAFGYFWPRPKVTRRKGGKVIQRHPRQWICSNL